MYIALRIHLNIAYAVQLLFWFSKNLRESHWETIQYVFQYLKDTHELELTYGKSTLNLHNYMDANRNMAED